MDIVNKFDTLIAKKIFGNIENASNFLKLYCEQNSINLPMKFINKGRSNERQEINLESKDLWSFIVSNWDYQKAMPIIRDLFKKTPKFKSGEESFEVMQILIKEWNELNLGNISWPFSQGDFDGFVQRLNSETINRNEKDEKVKNAALKYRRIKEINTVRNDFIETLIFKKNCNIVPTLNHNRSVDFFINGISYDQKVAKSPTNEFKKDKGEDWKNQAIQNPKEVAKYLYQFQDEGRFGSDSRLLVVYLDEDVQISRINKIINEVNLDTPSEIIFDYCHNKGKNIEKVETYKVQCYIILLYNL